MTLISDQLRRHVISRAGSRCEYCHLPVEGQVATFPLDHVTPRTGGGPTISENLALACPHCNSRKWAFAEGIDPDTGQPAPLFHPREQDWNEHFEWSQTDRMVLNGRTAVGRATITRLQMNAPEMLTVRRLLRELGIQLD